MAFVLPRYQEPDFKALEPAPDASLCPAPKDGVAPPNFHATTIFPEYFRVGGRWLLAEESRMDAVAVYRAGQVQVVEPRNLRAGDLTFTGREEDGSTGIYVHTRGFAPEEGGRGEAFAFRQGRSRETAQSPDYRRLTQLLRHERDQGRVLWVLGPACVFDGGSRSAMASLIREGYCHGLLAGNAVATHDLEGDLFGTALGQDIATGADHPLGHYHHLDLLNRVREAGGIGSYLAARGGGTGVMAACAEKGVPFVLAGSIRDDGPLPEVYPDVYKAQGAMRALVAGATTIIALATQLHTIAVGNMTPAYRVVKGEVRPVYFYVVDASEFAVNKLRDRGSLGVTTMVTNVQDFLCKLAASLTGEVDL